MATGPLAMVDARPTLVLGNGGRRAAQVAAGLTIGGATALAAFFAVGEPWGTLNDSLSIGLACATVPIAADLARRHPESRLLGLGLASDLIGVATMTTFTSLLISRQMTFEDSLQPILIGQALIGTWLILAGVAARSDPASRPASMLAITGGAGLIATAAGIATDGMTSPVAAVGFVAALVGTTGAYVMLGRDRSRRHRRA